MRSTLAAVILVAALAVAHAAEPGAEVAPIERAEYVVSDAVRPPADSAPWRPIRLPDNWRETRRGFSGQVWYRLHFGVAREAMGTHALYSPRTSAADMQFYVNGTPIARGGVHGDPRLTELQRPIIFTVPPALLRIGENTVHVRVAGNANLRQGLGRLTIGPGSEVRPHFYEPRYDIQVTSVGMFGAALLFAGVLALFVWGSERGDPVLFWFGMTTFAWAISVYLMLWPPQVEQIQFRQLLFFLMQRIYVTPLLVLCLRIGGVRLPRLEAVLWLAFASCCLAAGGLGFEGYAAFLGLAPATYLFVTIAFFAWLLYTARRRLEWPSYLLGLALATLIAFTGYDEARWMGLADFDNVLLAPFAAPFLILALGAAVVKRHMEALHALARANTDLEQRVADKVLEVEQSYRRMRDALHDRAVLLERQRIMGDMHDGLGAGLVTLLSRLQSRSVDMPQIEHRLSDILVDLKAIVDSLEPVEGDLGVVLGNVRYRMSEAIEESGVKFVWRVDPLPALDYLTPDIILSIQRIMLETLTNALRHAAASVVTVMAKVAPVRHSIVITISDDGIGFDPGAARAGQGLRNMRSRAAKIEIPLELRTMPGGGTTVVLELPSERRGFGIAGGGRGAG
jgi:signal transduction histidine kinase